MSPSPGRSPLNHPSNARKRDWRVAGLGGQQQMQHASQFTANQATPYIQQPQSAGVAMSNSLNNACPPSNCPAKLLTLTEQARQSLFLQQKLEAAGCSKKFRLSQKVNDMLMPAVGDGVGAMGSLGGKLSGLTNAGRSPFLAPASRKRKRHVSAIDQKRRLTCGACGQVMIVSFGDYVNGCCLCGAKTAFHNTSAVVDEFASHLSNTNNVSPSDMNMW